MLIFLLISVIRLEFSSSLILDKACAYKPADIIFALDGSGSERAENFNKQLEFVSNFTEQFEIGPNNTRIALLTFATSVKNRLDLRQTFNKSQVLQTISSTPYPDGETYTHLALEYIRSHTLSRRHDGRNVSKIVIVLTDGQSTDPDLTKIQAQRLKANPLVTVVAVGIGSRVDNAELQIIASDFNHTFHVSSFDGLQTILNELTDTTCNVCNSAKTDICFVLDSSGSEGSRNFHKQLEFVNLIVNEFEISQTETKICVVTFATKSRTEIRLDSYSTKPQVIQNVLRVPWSNGETMTHMGLTSTLTELQRHGRNGNKIAIVLTDGRSTEPTLTSYSADRLQKAGVETFAIGIGTSVDKKELATIASNGDHVFTVDKFNDLEHIHQEVVDKLCAKSSLLTTTTSTTRVTTTTLPPTTTKAECGLKPADIVFVLDSSDSEGQENFKKEVDFALRFASQFKIGRDNVQFSVVTFSSDVRHDFYFNTYHSRSKLLNAMRNISYMGQGTNTTGALMEVRLNSFDGANGGRTNASRYVIVITDGRSDDPDETKQEASKLRQIAEVISIGVGPKVDNSELKSMASAHRVLQVDNFDILQTIQNQLTDLAYCGLKPADIVFVLDSSNSEGQENFEKENVFALRFASQFKIGKHNAQFSVVTFSSKVRHEFYFNTYHSRSKLLNAMRSISYMGLGTNTSGALMEVRLNSFDAAHGGRTNASRYVIVITDGRSSDPDETKQEASKLRQIAEVISIGVGPKVDNSELKSMASAHRVLQVDNFDILQTIQNQLTDLACQSD